MGGGLQKALLLCAGALVVAATAGAARLDDGDFGDAPDSRPTGYLSGAATGTFPTLHEPDGTHSGDIDTVRLGTQATAESEARMVDTGDDGVSVALRPCATSTAYVAVTALARTGTAYLNLFFDWNRTGSWAELDRCGPEWAIRNVPIDLSQQRTRTQVYAIPFRGGVQTRELWYRATVSHEQRWTNDNGAGVIGSGEVEDYKLGSSVSKRARRKGRTVVLGASCVPSPLAVPRGGTGRIVVDRIPGSRELGTVSLAPGVKPKTRTRTLSVRGAALTYKSTGGPLQEVVRLRVTYPELGTLIVPCSVRVVPTPVTVTPARSDCTLVGPVSSFTPLGATGLRGRFLLGGQPRGWGRQCGGRQDAVIGAIEISGFGGAAATGAVVHLTDPARKPPPPTWGCTVVGPDRVRCAGPPELKRNQNYWFDVTLAGGLPANLGQVHVVLFTSAGEIVGSVESGRAA